MSRLYSFEYKYDKIRDTRAMPTRNYYSLHYILLRDP